MTTRKTSVPGNYKRKTKALKNNFKDMVEHTEHMPCIIPFRSLQSTHSHCTMQLPHKKQHKCVVFFHLSTFAKSI